MEEPSQKIKEFTDLKAWKESHVAAINTYKITKRFPGEEIFALSSQMQRAAVSVTSNIAEGFGRQGYKEKIQFYYLAQGSLTELKNQYILAKDIGYLNDKTYSDISKQLNLAHQLLQGLIKKSKDLCNS